MCTTLQLEIHDQEFLKRAKTCDVFFGLSMIRREGLSSKTYEDMYFYTKTMGILS